MRTSNIKDITNALLKAFVTSGRIDIDKQLKHALIKTYQNITAFNSQKRNSIQICPILWRSLKGMIPNLSIIGNVSTTCILILAVENDTQTPVEQAFLLQQRLAEVNHTDHSFITYPNPSSQWATGIVPIQQHVLADLYAWLAAPSGFTDHALAAPHVTSTLFSNLLLNRMIQKITTVYVGLSSILF
jgi:hypothetical protein